MVKHWPVFLSESGQSTERTTRYTCTASDIRATLEYRLLRLRMSAENTMKPLEGNESKPVMENQRIWSSLERSSPKKSLISRPKSCSPKKCDDMISPLLETDEDDFDTKYQRFKINVSAFNESLANDKCLQNSVQVVESVVYSGRRRTPSICISSSDDQDTVNCSKALISKEQLPTIDDVQRVTHRGKQIKSGMKFRKRRSYNSDNGGKQALSSTIARKGFQNNTKNCILDPILQKVTVHIRNYRKPDEQVV